MLSDLSLCIPFTPTPSPQIRGMVQVESIASGALAALEAVHAAVFLAEAQLHAQIELLRTRVEAIREKEQRMLAVAAGRRTKVKLNVGGRVFAVHKDEILKRKDSLFFYMLCSEVWLPGDDGMYCIWQHISHSPLTITSIYRRLFLRHRPGLLPICR